MNSTTTMSRSALSASIRLYWAAIVAQAEAQGLPAAVARVALDALPKGTLRLAGTSAKVEKGASARGVLAAVVYLSGAHAHKALCKWATSGCIATCLGHTAGRLLFDSARRPQAWKTALFLGDPATYKALVRLDMAALAGRARKEGAVPALRLDGASDTGLSVEMAEDAARLGVRLWEYTKSIERAAASLGGPVDVTLSYPGEGTDWAPYAAHVQAGGRVAVVVDCARGADLPAAWEGLPAVDGDRTDLRFTDPTGVVVLLRVKGTNKAKRTARRSGFSVPMPAGPMPAAAAPGLLERLQNGLDPEPEQVFQVTFRALGAVLDSAIYWAPSLAQAQAQARAEFPESWAQADHRAAVLA